ncbi:ATP-binding protein [Pseudomonas typographi]|uniref:ATP-binding protein n=1 Tax=Pseudomonas typographi TaxID=2715964 RepID=UPI00168633D7|nr:sensor histidine kinase [Pseudomonas typographi]
MKSIQGRLSLGLIGVLVMVGLITAQVSLWLFEAGLQRYLEAGLRSESESLLIAVGRDAQGLRLNPERLLPAYDRPFSGRYFRIDTPQSHWRSRSLWDAELPLPEQPGLHTDWRVGPDNQLLLVLRSDYRRYQQTVTITVAQDYTPVRQSFQRMRQVGLGTGAIALLLILILQRFTVKRALAPLERARQQIAQLRQGRRSQLDHGQAAELEPLIEQINHLLAHTEDSLKRARNATGNLGHALKTPLAVLLNLADHAQLKAAPALRQVMQEQLRAIEWRVGRELNRARLAGDALPGARFDCDEEIPILMQTLAKIHGGHLQLCTRIAPGLQLPREREDVLELLGNLLDNACKWADATVLLTIEAHADALHIGVDDDGPGIEPSRRQAVLERGQRLDESVQGHGLGLGIVRDIAQAWGARLELQASELGGLRAVVSWPLGHA